MHCVAGTTAGHPKGRSEAKEPRSGLTRRRPSDTPARQTASRDRSPSYNSIIPPSESASTLNVQPHNKFWMIDIKPQRIEGLLNEAGLYDHLFGFRQWTLPVTPRLLRSFFGDEHDAALIDKCGWGVADAELLSAALVKTVRKEPQRLTRADLMSTGVASRII